MHSFLTVHSRAVGQYLNEHWKDRYLERSGEYSIIIDEILKELKDALKSGQSKRSKVHKERVLVFGEDGLKYILAEQEKEYQGKKVYVPVTVLLPHMRFK